MSGWRVGTHYDIHVYEDHTPIATFHTTADAARAVRDHHATEYLTAYLTAALAKLAEYGWVPFGTNVDSDAELEFSDEAGEDGLPYFERAASEGMS